MQQSYSSSYQLFAKIKSQQTGIGNDMSSTKVFLCDLCILLVFHFSWSLATDAVGSVAGKSAPTDNTIPRGNCSCGGFATPTPAEEAEPLLSQMPGLVVQRNEVGEATCKALCLALATATKAKGPEILCSRLKDADELRLSAFFKVGDKPWSFAGMTAEAPLCCADSKVKSCDSAEAGNFNSTKTGHISTEESLL